ncbi:AAA family ATPase [Halorubrum sp. PV6]|uniref:AAA family ATPase n=1 Tax=Halorubrum sp. PV6 TaxID=634157 RepID=UPI000F851708|nr:AAA family ATPase [Halorubrum sp. PV6]AZQ14932.1 kinase [Halorubrum sp. PV6]
MTAGDETDADRASPDASAAGDLVVVCGLPGVGKSTVAERVAERVDGERLRTDVVRKELFEEPSYTDAETAAVYAALLDRARERVASGASVVLDATFADAQFRADAREVGESDAGSFTLVEVICEESVVKRRIERRDGISDADFEVHLQFKREFDEIDADHVVIDNAGAEAETLAQVDDAFGGIGPTTGRE